MNKLLLFSVLFLPVYGHCALDFNGTNQAVELGTNTIAQKINGKSQITVTAFMNPRSFPGAASGTALIIRINPGNTAGVILRTNGTKFIDCGGRALGTDAFQDSFQSTATAGVWAHYACVMDFAANQITLYQNGVSQGTKTVSFGATSYTSGTPTVVDEMGTITGTQSLDGQVSDMKIYTTAININKIESIGKSGTRINFSDPSFIDYWPMNEGADGQTAAGIGIVKDVVPGGGTNGNPKNGPIYRADTEVSYP